MQAFHEPTDLAFCDAKQNNDLPKDTKQITNTLKTFKTVITS